MDNTGYGKDMESTRDALEFHMAGVKEISDYRVNVERCSTNKVLCRAIDNDMYLEKTVNL